MDRLPEIPGQRDFCPGRVEQEAGLLFQKHHILKRNHHDFELESTICDFNGIGAGVFRLSVSDL